MLTFFKPVLELLFTVRLQLVDYSVSVTISLLSSSHLHYASLLLRETELHANFDTQWWLVRPMHKFLHSNVR